MDRPAAPELSGGNTPLTIPHTRHPTPDLGRLAPVKLLSEVRQEFLTGAYQYVLPETVLLGTACVLFVLAITVPRRAVAVASACWASPARQGWPRS